MNKFCTIFIQKNVWRWRFWHKRQRKNSHSIEKISRETDERSKYFKIRYFGCMRVLFFSKLKERKKKMSTEKDKNERILCHSPQIDSKTRFLLTEWLRVNEFMNSKFLLLLLILIINYTIHKWWLFYSVWYA